MLRRLSDLHASGSAPRNDVKVRLVVVREARNPTNASAVAETTTDSPMHDGVKPDPPSAARRSAVAPAASADPGDVEMNVRLSQLYPRQATSDVISNENPLFDTSKFDQNAQQREAPAKGVPEHKPTSAASPEPTPAAALSTRDGREYTLGDEEAPRPPE